MIAAAAKKALSESAQASLDGLNSKPSTQESAAVDEPIQAGPNRLDILEHRLTAVDPDVRAEATRRLIHTQLLPATDMIIQFLDDADPTRRHVALSLMEQTHQVAMMASVLKIARSDPDSALRRQAPAIVTQLHQALKAPAAGTSRTVGSEPARTATEGTR